jgi:hypothetical protein
MDGSKVRVCSNNAAGFIIFIREDKLKVIVYNNNQ